MPENVVTDNELVGCIKEKTSVHTVYILGLPSCSILASVNAKECASEIKKILGKQNQNI